MKEAKKDFCEKCGNYFYTHSHHILPKAIYGKKGKTAELCPNCHTHFHEYSKQKTTDPKDAVEAEKIWATWLKTIAITFTIAAIGWFAAVA